MTDWQPIETAPRDGTEILLYDQFCRWRPHATFVGRWAGDDLGSYHHHWITSIGAYNKKATHWMPLPGPPKND